MYALEQELKRLIEKRNCGPRWLEPAIARRLVELAERYRRTVTLYLDRRGNYLQAATGDATVEARHLRRRGTNRLSGVRALRAVPPREDFPRGRDRREVAEACLDGMFILGTGGRGVLLTPGIRDGVPDGSVDEEAGLSLEEMAGRGVDEHVGGLERRLGRHRKLSGPPAKAPRTLLVGVDFTAPEHQRRGGGSLDELARLAETAGLDPAGRTFQRRRAPRPGTLVGRGKLEEIRARVLDEDFRLVVFGCELPYPVTRRLGEELGVRVLDRAELILEIFSRHAMTQEGRLQVKLARLEHDLHRLLKEQKDLDRQGGGIGVLGGPGETAATLLRRRIHRKKLRLERRLETSRRRRIEGRRRRAEGAEARVSLTGYTNAGKSSLLNALAGREESEAADRLFATLTTTTRRIPLPSGRPVLWSDTVGFVEKLPHHLVAAFESTLAEAVDTDLAVVLVEANGATLERDLQVIDEVLSRLGTDPPRRVLALSKVDRLSPGERRALRLRLPDAVEVSSLTGEGLPELLARVEEKLGAGEREVELRLPFSHMALFDELVRGGRVVRHRFVAEGVRLTARLDPRLAEELEEHVIRE